MQVMEKQCDQCLFSKNRIVSGARFKEILKDCAQHDSHFICHKASIAGKDVCCRGFYDQMTSSLICFAQRINYVRFVSISEKAES